MNVPDFNANLEVVSTCTDSGNMQNNPTYQHLKKLKEKVRMLEEDNAAIRQSYQDHELNLDIDKVEMPELMQNKLRGNAMTDSTDNNVIARHTDITPPVIPPPAPRDKTSPSRTTILTQDDLWDADLIDVDTLQGNEQNWLTGPNTEGGDDEDCLEWLRSDMEANRDSLLESRIFHKISFNSSLNSSGCSRNSSKIGSPEISSTPSKPYRGVESRNMTGLNYQQTADLKLRMLRNSGGYHRLAYAGPEEFNRTMDLGQERRPGGGNTTYPHVQLPDIQPEPFLAETPLNLSACDAVAESTPLPEKPRRVSNINTATITRPRSMKTVIRTGEFGGSSNTKLDHSTDQHHIDPNQDQQCSSSVSSNQVCDTTFEKQLTNNKTFEQAQSGGNRTFDSSQTKTSTPQSLNKTFDNNKLSEPNNRTFDRRTNTTFDRQSSNLEDSPPPATNTTFETINPLNRTFDGDNQGTANRTFEGQNSAHNRTFDGPNAGNRTFDGRRLSGNRTFEGAAMPRKMSEDRNSSCNSSNQMSRESSNDGLLEDMDVLSGDMDRLSTASGLSESSTSHRLNDVQDVQDIARIQEESLRNPQNYQLRSATLSPNSEASLSSPQDIDPTPGYQSEESCNSESGGTLTGPTVNPAFIHNNRKYSNRSGTSRYSSQDSLPDSPYSSQSLDTKNYQDTETYASMPNLNRFGNRQNAKPRTTNNQGARYGLGNNQHSSEGKLQNSEAKQHQPRPGAQVTRLQIQGGVARSVPQPPQQQNQQPKTSVDHHQFARPSQPPPARKVSGIARPSGIAQPSRIGRPSLGAPPSTRLPAPGSRIGRTSSTDRRAGSVGPGGRVSYSGVPQNRNQY